MGDDDENNDLISKIVSGNPNEQRIRTVANDSLTAYSLYRRIRTIGLILLSILSVLVTWYLLFFIVMEDKQWYDWMRLWQVLVVLGLMLLVFKPSYVIRMFELVLVLAFVALVFDVIAVSYINPLDIDTAHDNNRRKNVKELLLIFSAFFVSLDFIIFVVALYYRFFSALGNEYILDLYTRAGTTVPRWFQLAIMADITHTVDSAVKSRARQQIKSTEQYNRDTEFVSRLVQPQQPPPSSLVTPTPIATPVQQSSQPPLTVMQVQQTTGHYSGGQRTMADDLRALAGPDPVDCMYVSKPPAVKHKNKKF